MKIFRLLKIYARRKAYFFVQALLYRKKSVPQTIDKILLVRLNHIGDLFVTLPAVYCVKKKYPRAEITLVTGAWNRGLAEFQKQLFDKICYYNLDSNCRNEKQKMKLSEKKEILKKLREEKYDLCLDFDGSWGFLWLYLVSGVKYLFTAEYLRFNQNLEQMRIRKNRFNYDINKNHEGDNVFEVAGVAGVKDFREEFTLQIDPSVRDKAESFLKKAAGGKKVLGIHPSASISQKMWTQKGFAALCDFLISVKGLSLIMFGAKEDREYIDGILEKMEEKKDIAVQTEFNIGEFITAASLCDYFICLDSLAQHIVQFFDKPSIIIYMTGNSARWSRKKENIKTIVLEDRNEYSSVISLAERCF